MSKCVFLLFFKVTFEWAGFHSAIPVAWEAPSPVGYGWVQGQLGGFKVSWPFEDRVCRTQPWSFLPWLESDTRGRRFSSCPWTPSLVIHAQTGFL